MLLAVTVGLTQAVVQRHLFAGRVPVSCLLSYLHSVTCLTIICFSRLWRIVWHDGNLPFPLISFLVWTYFTPAIGNRILAAVVKVTIESVRRGVMNFFTKATSWRSLDRLKSRSQTAEQRSSNTSVASVNRSAMAWMCFAWLIFYQYWSGCSCWLLSEQIMIAFHWVVFIFDPPHTTKKPPPRIQKYSNEK